MNSSPRICVFYSKGRSFLDVLRVVRVHYPGATLCAILPPDYPINAEERAFIDEPIATDISRYSLRTPIPLGHLISRIRESRYSIFVITFDSPKLNILAALSRVPEKIYCSFDGRLVPIRPSVFGVIADLAYRNIRGRLTYGAIWLAVHCLKVGRDHSST